MELVPWVDPDALLRTKVIPDQEVCLYVCLKYISPSAMSWDEGHKTTQLWVACTTAGKSPLYPSLIIVCKWGLTTTRSSVVHRRRVVKPSGSMRMKTWQWKDDASELFYSQEFSYAALIISVLFWTLLTVTVFYASNYEKQSMNYIICVCLCKLAGLMWFIVTFSTV